MAAEFRSSTHGEPLSLQPDTPIAGFDLPIPTTERLHALGIRTLRELALTPPELLRRTGFGLNDVQRLSAAIEIGRAHV